MAVGAIGGMLPAGNALIPNVLPQSVTRAVAGALGNIMGQGLGDRDKLNLDGVIGSAIGGALGGVLAPRGWGPGPDALGALANIGQRAAMGLPGASLSATGGFLGTAIGNGGSTGSCKK